MPDINNENEMEVIKEVNKKDIDPNCVNTDNAHGNVSGNESANNISNNYVSINDGTPHMRAVREDEKLLNFIEI